MLRLQTPLPDTYSSATPEDLATRIGRAKAALGSRVVILGHHYQRAEVMRWADFRGDSFGLSRLAADNHPISLRMAFRVLIEDKNISR